MEQPDPAQLSRKYAAAQIGDQVMALCDAHAQIDVLKAQLAAVTAERDALKKAGESES